MMYRKSLLALGVATAMAAPAAFAAAPVGFGQFTYDSSLATGIDGSGISLSTSGGTGLGGACASGFTCSDSVVSDKGFLQIQMTEDATGKTYFQTIIADDGATPMMGDMRSESFVGTAATGTAGGVAAWQDISAGTGAVDDVSSNNNGLSSTATFLTGDFDGAGDTSAVLSQTIWDNTAESSAGAGDGTTFDTGFSFTKADEADEGMAQVTAGLTDGAAGFNADFYAGMRMDMGTGDMLMDVGVQQSIADGSVATGDAFSDSFAVASTMNETTEMMVAKVVDINNDVQLISAADGGTATDSTFDYSLRMGSDPGMVPMGSLADTIYGSFAGVTAGVADVNGALADGTVDWVNGDTIAQVLIGQNTGEGLFGFNSVADQTDTDGAGTADDMGMEEYSNLSSTGPFVDYYEADGTTPTTSPF